MTETNQSRTKDFWWITVAYCVALLVAISGVMVIDLLMAGTESGRHLAQPLYRSAIADVLGTLVIFGFSRAFGNSSFYDAYWSVIPPLLLGYWFWAYGVLDLRLGLVWLLVSLWAIRLTHNWARGWQGLEHVDWRYVDLKQTTGWAYPIVDLLGIQLLPTVLVFLGCLPVWVLVTATAAGTAPDLGWLDLMWLSVGFGALYLEFRADNVLRVFRLDPDNAGKVLRYDVWAWCRHPNYLGELGFWLALALAGFTSAGHPGASHLWVWLGFALMVVLFVGISVPMIDKRQLTNKPDYQAYKDEVYSFLPLPPK